MKKIFALLTFLIFVGIFIPVVSAEKVLYDEEINDYEFTGFNYAVTDGGGVPSSNKNEAIGIYFKQISNATDLSYIVIDFTEIPAIFVDQKLEEGRSTISYSFTSNPSVSNEVIVYTEYRKNILGQITGIRYTLFFQNWDVNELTGSQTLKFDSPLLTCRRFSGVVVEGMEQMKIVGSNGNLPFHKFTVSCGKNIRNHITISETDNDYNVRLQRVLDKQYFSTLTTKLSDTVYYTESGNTNLDLYFLKSEIDSVELVTGLSTHLYPLSPGFEATNNTVTVYVRNSQTGTSIANSRCVIDALVDGDYYPVVNRTEPSGIFSVTLQPTGGGSPNPDGYRLIASADGYNNPMPEINFTVDKYTTSIYCYLDPIAGGPIDENKTFIDFFVRDLSANPISGATVNFGGYTLLTNSQGYTVFEINKNATYTYTVSKSGYGPLTGNVVIGDDPRHTINTVIAPAVTPTTPTAIPTSTPISPTPTMTAPTGEPVSNWLEWFAAHFGMILGGGAEIGKIFMWLCFSVPVGVYVAKESKAGAAGFMAGAGIVTLFFVLIGWVPIWLLVFIALIIGLLYAKIFNNSDNGGGR